MSFFASPRFLRNVLLLDAATGLVSGALQLGAPAWLAALTGLPPALLLESGVFLLLYAAALAWLASRHPIPASGVWLLVVGNPAWAVACILLMVGPWLQPTAWGLAYLAVHAVSVLVMAQLQWMGLRRLRPPHLIVA
jgi:hypothetical protein